MVAETDEPRLLQPILLVQERQELYAKEREFKREGKKERFVWLPKLIH